MDMVMDELEEEKGREGGGERERERERERNEKRVSVIWQRAESREKERKRECWQQKTGRSVILIACNLINFTVSRKQPINSKESPSGCILNGDSIPLRRVHWLVIPRCSVCTKKG